MDAAKVLVDTNVLVYAYDRSEPEKQKRALHVLDACAETETGVLSTQVLSEFFWNVTRKIPTPLSILDACERVQVYASAWSILDITELIVLEALRGVREHQFAYWDAQIWATARLNQIPLILSEDFSDGAIIEGIRFQNPFLPAFDLHVVLA
ncbi:MAG: PIN domain-containing protein [Chloroflexi bacterium]|nr:PIN domain-containing protein [Chloroflexota bacterium]